MSNKLMNSEDTITSYETYENWARQEQGIQAPKIKITSIDNIERKIEAIEEIHPNERIMFIPSSALISRSNVALTELSECSIPRNDDIRKAEYEAMIEITRIQKMVKEEWGGEWRNDDTIALFLIAGKKIINDYGLPDVLSQDNIPSAEPLVSQDDAIHLDAQVISIENPTSNPSSYLHHISILPKSFPSIPLYFNPDEITKLEGTNCHVYTTRMQHQTQNDYERLLSILQSSTLPEFTLEDYKWAMCNIFSRSTDFFVEEEGIKRVIAPMFDCMNHSFESQVYHSMDVQGNISVFNGNTAIPANEEVFLNYGHFPNEKLLLVYGFTTLPNPYDAVQLYAPIPTTDPLYMLKTNMLVNQFGMNHSDPDLLTLETPLPSTLLTKLRITGIKDEMELLHLVSKSLDEKQVSFISVENERNGLKALEYALYGMTRQIALNLIHDDNLNAGALSSTEKNVEDVTVVEEQEINFRNAKTLCSVEYEILIAALNEVRDCLGRLDID